MKKRNGFVFIETIIVIVFLIGALLLLYGSYRNAITEEKTKVYYDDISYLYRNYYLADFIINKKDIYKIKKKAFKDKYIIELDGTYEEIFNEEQKEENYEDELKNIVQEFNVHKMLIVSDEIITECFNNDNPKCEKSYEGLSDGLSKYIETMEIEKTEEDNDKTYYLVTEYRERSTEEGTEKCEENDENCEAFYVTLKLDINKKINTEASTIGEVCRNQNLVECMKDNYDIENNEEGGIYHHDKDGNDSGEGDNEAGDDSYRYGGIVNNYVCFGSDEEKCPEANLYRIIGVIDGKLRIIKNEDTKNKWNGIKTKGNTISEYASKWQNMVEESLWYVDGISSIDKNALEVYEEEITGTTEKGKEGLMYVSDYMYGAYPTYWKEKGSNYTTAKDKNWLYILNTTNWSVSKEKSGSNSYAVNEVGNVGVNPKTNESLSRRVYNLKNSVILIGGSGSIIDPYRISDTGVIVKGLTGTEDYHDLDVTADAETLEGKIVKYYFSIDDGQTWYEESENHHNFSGLESNTEYTVSVKVLNNRGNYSEEYSETFKTKAENPSVTLELVSKDTHNIKVKAKATVPVGTLQYYEYQINGGSWQKVTTNSLTNEKSYGSLNSNTNYTIKVKITDSLNKTSEEATLDVKTDYEKPSVKLSVTSRRVYDITVQAVGTNGSGTIKEYEFQLDNGSWEKYTSSNLTYNKTYDSLLKNHSYTIRVRVTDNNGVVSDVAEVPTSTTDLIPPSVSLGASTSTSSITAYATAYPGSGYITKYEFRKDWGSWINEGSYSSHSFGGLNPGSSYYIEVKVTDSYGQTASDGRYVRTDDITGPTVRITSTSSTSSSITVYASGSRGTGALSRYVFSINGGSSQTVSTSTGSASATFSGLSASSNYTVSVTLYDVNGLSDSDSSSATTKAEEKNGWFYEDCWRFYSNGVSLTGWQYVYKSYKTPNDYANFYLGTNGCMVTGPNVQIGSCYYYLDRNEGMLTNTTYYCIRYPSSGCGYYDSSIPGCGGSSGGSSGSVTDSCGCTCTSPGYCTYNGKKFYYQCIKGMKSFDGSSVCW